MSALNLVGEITGPHTPPDPGKGAFLEAVTAALWGPDTIGRITDGYGYGGEHSSGAEPLDAQDRLAIALRAWYAYLGSPGHPGHMVNAEAAWILANGIDRTPATITAGDAGLTGALNDLGDRLKGHWRPETSADADVLESWEKVGSPVGQCVPTALIVQDRFGGELLQVGHDKARTGGHHRRAAVTSSHYFNRLPSGLVVDLTRAQFDKWAPYGPAELRTREHALSGPGVADRYTQLAESLARYER